MPPIFWMSSVASCSATSSTSSAVMIPSMCPSRSVTGRATPVVLAGTARTTSSRSAVAGIGHQRAVLDVGHPGVRVGQDQRAEPQFLRAAGRRRPRRRGCRASPGPRPVRRTCSRASRAVMSGAEGDVPRRHVPAGRLGRVAEQVAGGLQLVRRTGSRAMPAGDRGRQLLQQPGLVVRRHPGQDAAHLVVGQGAEEPFLVVRRQVGEHPAGLVAGQQAEDGGVVLVGHLEEDVGDVGRVEVGQVVAEDVPALLADQLLKGGAQQPTESGHGGSGERAAGGGGCPVCCTARAGIAYPTLTGVVTAFPPAAGTRLYLSKKANISGMFFQATVTWSPPAISMYSVGHPELLHLARPSARAVADRHRACRRRPGPG